MLGSTLGRCGHRRKFTGASARRIFHLNTTRATPVTVSAETPRSGHDRDSERPHAHECVPQVTSCPNPSREHPGPAPPASDPRVDDHTQPNLARHGNRLTGAPPPRRGTIPRAQSPRAPSPQARSIRAIDHCARPRHAQPSPRTPLAARPQHPGRTYPSRRTHLAARNRTARPGRARPSSRTPLAARILTARTEQRQAGSPPRAAAPARRHSGARGPSARLGDEQGLAVDDTGAGEAIEGGELRHYRPTVAGGIDAGGDGPEGFAAGDDYGAAGLRSYPIGL